MIFPVDLHCGTGANLNTDGRALPDAWRHRTRRLLARTDCMYICRTTNDIDILTGFPHD